MAFIPAWPKALSWEGFPSREAGLLAIKLSSVISGLFWLMGLPWLLGPGPMALWKKP